MEEKHMMLRRGVTGATLALGGWGRRGWAEKTGLEQEGGGTGNPRSCGVESL